MKTSMLHNRRVSMLLTADDYERLRRVAFEERVNIAVAARRAVEKALAEHDSQDQDGGQA